VRGQGTATTEIARLIGATEAVARIAADRIAEVSAESAQTGAEAGHVRGGATDLVRTAARMQATVVAALDLAGRQDAA